MLQSGLSISHYRLLRRLKVGGMGEIYLANDELLARQVAIKVIMIDYSHYTDNEAAEEAMRLFLREARAIARFNHDHILHVYEANQDTVGGVPLMYMVMPYCPEGSLADWLHNHQVPLPLPVQDVEHIVTQAGEALQHAHNHQIIHQDVKPANFLVQQPAQYPAQLKLQLADFGIAKLLITSGESQSIRGTPFYMAPEQWQGRALPQTDQYSLAVMTYELLVGKRPFQGTNAQQIWYQHVYNRPGPPSAFNAYLPQTLDEVILRALAKNPSDRYPSVTTFMQAFQRAFHRSGSVIPTSRMSESLTLTDMAPLPSTIQVPPPTTNHTRRPPEQRQRGSSHRSILLLLLILLVIAASSGLFFYLRQQETQLSALTLHETATAQAQRTDTAQVQLRASVQAQQTGTAQAQQTATAQIQANETATASAVAASVAATHTAATATAAAVATATVTNYYNELGVSGPPDLIDPLSDNSQSNRWDVVNYEDVSCGFAQNKYYIAADANNYIPCFARATNYNNMVYQMTQAITKGDQGGITFCVNTHTGNFYAFIVSQSGSYALILYQDTQAIKTLAQGTSTAIRTGIGQSNLLAVRVANGTITMFINRQPLPPVNDSTYTIGAIGAIAASSGDPTVVDFTDAEVWKLS